MTYWKKGPTLLVPKISWLDMFVYKIQFIKHHQKLLRFLEEAFTPIWFGIIMIGYVGQLDLTWEESCLQKNDGQSEVVMNTFFHFAMAILLGYFGFNRESKTLNVSCCILWQIFFLADHLRSKLSSLRRLGNEISSKTILLYVFLLFLHRKKIRSCFKSSKFLLYANDVKYCTWGLYDECDLIQEWNVLCQKIPTDYTYAVIQQDLMINRVSHIASKSLKFLEFIKRCDSDFCLLNSVQLRKCTRSD